MSGNLLAPLYALSVVSGNGPNADVDSMDLAQWFRGPLSSVFFYCRYSKFFEKLTVEDFGPRVLYRRFLGILSCWISMQDFF